MLNYIILLYCELTHGASVHVLVDMVYVSVYVCHMLVDMVYVSVHVCHMLVDMVYVSVHVSHVSRHGVCICACVTC